MARRRGERREFWQKMIGEQARSGLPVRRFCAQAKISEPSFYAWRARLRRQTAVEFALVEPRTLPHIGASEIEVRMSTGEELRIPAGADAATLRMVLAALRG